MAEEDGGKRTHFDLVVEQQGLHFTLRVVDANKSAQSGRNVRVD